VKTLRITDDVHQKLTALLGDLTAQTSRMQTYTDAVEALLKQSVVLPAALLLEIESYIDKNKQLGYTTREEFIRDAARWRLRFLSQEYESIEIPREDYEKMHAAIKEMNLPVRNTAEFINQQIKNALEKYDEWQRQRDTYEKRQRKKG